jgi:hypothetical protein
MCHFLSVDHRGVDQIALFLDGITAASTTTAHVAPASSERQRLHVRVSCSVLLA